MLDITVNLIRRLQYLREEMQKGIEVLDRDGW